MTKEELEAEYAKRWDAWHAQGTRMLKAMSDYDAAEQMVLDAIKERGRLFRALKHVRLALDDNATFAPESGT